MSAASDTSADRSGAPLAGRAVLIMRTREQSRSLAEPLEALGAEVLAMPVLELADPPDPGAVDVAIGELASYDWVVLTSANAVERFLDRPALAGCATEALAGVKVAAVGRATAAYLRERGIEPDLVPADARAEGLVAAFRELGVGAGTRVLVPRALKAREVLPAELRAAGAHVDVVPVYQAVALPADPAVLERLRAGTIDCGAFTSGAIAEAFVSAIREAGLDVGSLLARVAIASIGPVTTQALAALGFAAGVEAETQAMGPLAEAIAEHFAARG